MTDHQHTLYANDCLDVLCNPHAIDDNSVDLIYLDPPFNSNSNYNLPFKGKYKHARPVQAFKDTWQWQDEDTLKLQQLREGHTTGAIADIIDIAYRIQRPRRPSSKNDLAAYLLNMAQRLLAMKRILKDSGSIYLHCDPTAGHYLKLLMDAIFGDKQFRNEIVWGYKASNSPVKSFFPRKHDTLLFYAMSAESTFNRQYTNYTDDYIEKAYRHRDEHGRRYRTHSKRKDGTMRRYYLDEMPGAPVLSWWTDIQSFGTATQSKERLGYPTQKPVDLLERIIQASSNSNDLILDPFCGCGTTLVAAHRLNRRWIGIDISRFATELVHNRLLSLFPNLKNITTRYGVPTNVPEAYDLAREDPFEFEKWVCGYLGAEGMYHNPGDRGADGGVDGVLKFRLDSQPAQRQYAIIQVKSGKVTPDSVRALYQTVQDSGAKAGIFVHFSQYTNTVENNRSHDTFQDAFMGDGKHYPIIQGLTIEDMLDNPYGLMSIHLPNPYVIKSGRTEAIL